MTHRSTAPEIRTERLHLRPPTAHDVPAWTRLHGDPATNAFTPHGPPSPERMRTMFTGALSHWERHGFGYWVVTEHDDSAVIGVGGLIIKRISGEQVLNLYYRFTPSVWGRGYATEMGRAALEWGRAHRPRTPVIALIRDANVPSIRVAVRIGLRFDRALTSEGMRCYLYRDPDHGVGTREKPSKGG